MRLWHFSSSVKSFFKRACAAIQWGWCLIFSWTIIYFHTSCVQMQRLWRNCTDVQALVGWLCWGLTSQSTIFQSYRDGAIASWVINQYFRGVKCLAQGHNTTAVGLKPRTSRSGVRHSTTEPPRSPGCAGFFISLVLYGFYKFVICKLSHWWIIVYDAWVITLSDRTWYN